MPNSIGDEGKSSDIFARFFKTESKYKGEIMTKQAKQKKGNEEMKSDINEINDGKQKIKLPSGVEVSTDFARAKAKTLFKARTASNAGQSTLCYILAETCLFDGKKLAGEDIEEFDFVDFVLLETAWTDYQSKKLKGLAQFQV